MKKLSKLVSLMLSAVLCIGMASPALAAVTFDVSYGSVTVNEEDSTGYGEDGNRFTSQDRDIIITGSYTETDKKAVGSVIAVGENVTDATITLKNVNIDASTSGEIYVEGESALSIEAGSNVTVKLEGENTLKSGNYRAGLELNDGASVTIQSDPGVNGSLTAVGIAASGIGTGVKFKDNYISTAGDITISGSAVVDATGSEVATGIGSGFLGTVGDITISDCAKVTAKGGEGALGIGAGIGGTVGDITISCGAKVTATVGKVVIDHSYQAKTKSATCTEDGETVYTCSRCGDSYTVKGDPATGHNNYTSAITKEATCTENGEKTYTCVKGDHSYTEVIPAKGHGEGVWMETTPAQPGVPGVETLVCPDCGESLGQTRPIPALPVPPAPDNGGADTAPDASTIEDQAVPLAGLMPLYMLLEELRQYEEIPEIELPEDFKWIDHEYAQAIYWGLQEELVVDTEEEPLDPDEVITVALLREVLVNFVEYKGADLAVTLEGEDDEIVFDLGERLAAFYAELEASLKAQETKAA